MSKHVVFGLEVRDWSPVGMVERQNVGFLSSAYLKLFATRKSNPVMENIPFQLVVKRRQRLNAIC